MSENAKPLWDDEEIEGFVRRNVPTASNIYVLLRSAMKMVRNDYESVRKNNQERVSRIEAELAAAWQKIEQLKDELADTYGECISFVNSYGIGDEDRYRARYRELTGKEYGE